MVVLQNLQNFSGTGWRLVARKPLPAAGYFYNGIPVPLVKVNFS